MHKRRLFCSNILSSISDLAIIRCTGDITKLSKHFLCGKYSEMLNKMLLARQYC